MNVLAFLPGGQSSGPPTVEIENGFLRGALDPTVAGKAVVDLGGNNMFAAFDSVTSVKIKNIDIKNGGSDGNGAGG